MLLNSSRNCVEGSDAGGDAVSQTLADEVGISASQVRRVCTGLDLKPWQVRSWMASHDP